MEFPSVQQYLDELRRQRERVDESIGALKRLKQSGRVDEEVMVQAREEAGRDSGSATGRVHAMIWQLQTELERSPS